MSAALDLLKDYQLFYSHYLKKEFLEEFPEYLTVQGNDLQEWDKEVIRHYTGQGYSQLNRHLREGSLTDYTVSYRNILNHALDKIPSYAGRVFRGIATNTEINVENMYKEGEIIICKDFSSTSQNRKVVFEYFIDLKQKNNLFFDIFGYNGKAISPYSMYPEENEILFKSPSEFRVLALKYESKKNIYTVIMEEIRHGTIKS